MQVYRMTKPEAGRILSMLAVGTVIGSPLLSYLSNNLFRGRKPVIVISSAVVLVITYFIAFHTGGISVFGHYTLCLGLGIFSSAIDNMKRVGLRCINHEHVVRMHLRQ